MTAHSQGMPRAPATEAPDAPWLMVPMLKQEAVSESISDDDMTSPQRAAASGLLASTGRKPRRPQKPRPSRANSVTHREQNRVSQQRYRARSRAVREQMQADIHALEEKAAALQARVDQQDQLLRAQDTYIEWMRQRRGVG